MIQAKEGERTHQRLTELISKFTKRPYDECAAAINRNNYMSAQEAIDFGLIDSITWKREAQNSGVQKSNSVDTPTLPPAVLTVEDKKLEKSGTSPYQR